MGKNLSRREFIAGAAVAIAGAALSGSRLQLVRQAARSLKVQAAAAVDPDPDPEPARSQGEWAERVQELGELYLELNPEARKMAFEAVHGLYIYCIQHSA